MLSRVAMKGAKGILDGVVMATLGDFEQHFLRPFLVKEARQMMFDVVGWHATSLVWFGGRYRAMPK